MEQRTNKKWDSMTQPFPKYIKFWWVFWRLGAGSRCLWAWSSTHQYVWKREEKEIIKFYSKSHGIDIMGPLIIISFILLFALLSSIWMVSLKSDLLRKMNILKTMVSTLVLSWPYWSIIKLLCKSHRSGIGKG